MPRTTALSPRAALPWVAAYLATGFVVALLQPDLGPSPWYPPVAIGLALFVLGGRSWWPAVLACELLISWLEYRSVGPAAASAVVTVLEQFLGAALLLRWGFDARFRRIDDAWKVVGAALALAVAGAVLGVTLTRTLGFVDGTRWQMLRTWGVGELTGVTAFLPVLLLLFASPRSIGRHLGGLRGPATVELVVAALLALVPTAVVFAWIGPSSVQFDDIGAVVLLPLPLLWVALRFGRYRATLLALLVDVVALGAIAVDAGTHPLSTVHYTSVQLFMLFVTLVVLFTSVAMDAQRESAAFEHMLVDRTPLALVSVDRDGLVTLWSGTAPAMFGWTAPEVLGTLLPNIRAEEREAWFRSLADPSPTVVERRLVRADGSTFPARIHTTPLFDARGRVDGRFAIVEDDSVRRAAEFERDLVGSAINQAAEAVLVTGTDGSILFANHAAAELTGRSRSELVGDSAELLGWSISPTEYERIVAPLLAGESWTGTLGIARVDGSRHPVEGSIAPVRSAGGHLQAYVVVMRDVSRERTLEADLAREQAERVVLAEAFSAVHTGLTPERTALGLCRAARRVEGIDGAMVLRLRSDGLLAPLGADLPVQVPELRGAMPPTVSALLLTRAAAGPFVFDWHDAPWDGPVVQALARGGMTALGGAPIVWDGQLRGVFLCGTGRSDGAIWLGAGSTTLTEVAGHAAALLGPQLARLDVGETEHSRIRALIDEHRFRAVFQPVFRLTDAAVVGYEGLSRFDDGTRPDTAFAAAHAVGLGHELELACATAMIEAAIDLPPEAWLSINASPSFVLAGLADGLAALTSRPLVLEVTEHVAVDDYPGLRAALDRITGLRLAVDDAGAGYASLHHVVELRPDFVKLDIALTRGVEADPARQAMIAGMRHFAAETGTALIAEGIETEAEAETMRRLGVDFGQGYLLGRPAPAGELAAQTATG